MLMDLNSKGLVFDHPLVKGKELEEFTRKYSILSADELKKSLEVDRTEFMSVLSQSVPCVGCRRSVERLHYQLMLSGHPTLDPIVITEAGVLTVLDDKIASPQAICTLLHKHNVLLNSLLENQHRNKKSSRCALHSRDSFRSRPFSDVWRDVWNCMKQKCRDEISHINAEELHVTLEGYLKKHKFCQECRTKVGVVRLSAADVLHSNRPIMCNVRIVLCTGGKSIYVVGQRKQSNEGKRLRSCAIFKY